MRRLRSGPSVVCLFSVLFSGCAAHSDPNSESDTVSSGGTSGAKTSGGTGGTSVGGSNAGGAGGTSGAATNGGSGGASAGAGGAGEDAGAGGGDGLPVHTVGACDNLGEPGVWELISPPELHPEKWCSPGTCVGDEGEIETYGAHGMAVDPTTSGKVWLGTGNLGLWKTSDCGGSWTKIDTGTHHEDIDGGRNWSIAIDPTNPEVVWTVSGYGASGIWKSTNGGVDFENMVTANIEPRIPYGGFVEKITLAPQNPDHVVVSFHAPCTTQANVEYPCLAVSTDAGATWSLTNSAWQAGEGDGQTMIDETTWYFGNGGGIWRTTNAGTDWAELWTVGNAGTSGAVFTASDGTYYSAGPNIMAHSVDGTTWMALANSHGGGTINGANRIAEADGRIYTSINQYGGSMPDTGLYYSFPLSDPTAWEPAFQPEPAIKSGSAVLSYDPDHRLMYSANMVWGIWRVVVPM